MTAIEDGPCSFVHTSAGWPGMRYAGEYRDGCREGLWRVSDAATGRRRWEITWARGQWHGPAKTWWKNGRIKTQGSYERGQVTGTWRFWFENGQLAAEGDYAADRKVGEWRYWNEAGEPTECAEWQREYERWDWAYDDYTGFPRGENWPEPPGPDVLS